MTAANRTKRPPPTAGAGYLTSDATPDQKRLRRIERRLRMVHAGCLLTLRHWPSRQRGFRSAGDDD